MNSYGNMMDSAEFISRLMKTIEANAFDQNSKLVNTWRKVVGSVKNYGERLTAHTQVVDIKNGVLLVETDHSSWNQILQLNSRYIIKGMNMYAPELEVRSLAFKARGSEAKLFDSYEEALEKSRAASQKKMENDEKSISEFYEKLESSKAQEKPENSEISSEPVKIEGELAEKLERLRNTMLTSNENK
ncbi:MAG: DUF721 domain-containing protein [Treponema sp.]|nr:DUF721 domain-containing protein [Treponema sp.]